MDRRSFLAGILAFGMAPAVVKASSIMRVRPIVRSWDGGYALLTGEIGRYDGITFYEQNITIDQMRRTVDEMRLRAIPPDSSGSYWVHMTKAHEDQWVKEIARETRRFKRVVEWNNRALMLKR